jgi:GTP-binding protein EngB required for normal cell division
MAATKGKLSSFARASKDRLSGRRLIQPSEGKKKPHIHAFTSSKDTNSDPEDEQETFLNSDKNRKGVNDVGETSKKAIIGPENCCIICVGSTGAGKSSTITKLTGQHVPSGNSTHRVTQRCTIYRSKLEFEENIIQEKNVFLVDTVGWDDADCDDDDTFKDILRFIESNSIVNVKAVIWSVIPSPRLTNELTIQAKLINKLIDKRIWGRVIIVCKQSMNPEQDTRGALKAALDYDAYANVQILGYRYLDDPSFTPEQHAQFENDPTIRETFNVLSDEEVRKKFKDMFSNIGPPTKLVFEHQRCLDCGALGDARLMPKFCHMKKVRVHRVQYPEKVHPLPKVSYHPNEVPIPVHPGYLHRPPWYRNIRLRRVYSCCGGVLISPGCALKWTCCQQQHKIVFKQNGLASSLHPSKANITKIPGCSKKYSCCEAEINVDHEPEGCEQLFSCCGRNKNQEGCREICLKCNEDWGTDAGKCFIKPHNITDLLPEGTNISKQTTETNQDNIHVMSEDNQNALINETDKTFLQKCRLPDVIPMIPYPVL